MLNTAIAQSIQEYNNNRVHDRTLVGFLVLGLALCTVLLGLLVYSYGLRRRARRQGLEGTSENYTKASRLANTCFAFLFSLGVISTTFAMVGEWIAYHGDWACLLSWAILFDFTLIIILSYTLVTTKGDLIAFTINALIAIGFHTFGLYLAICLYRDWYKFGRPSPFDCLAAIVETIFGLLACLVLKILIVLGWYRVVSGKPIQPTRSEVLNGKMAATREQTHEHTHDGQMDGAGFGRSTDQIQEFVDGSASPVGDVEAFSRPAPAYHR